jgi:hypothetical protein
MPKDKRYHPPAEDTTDPYTGEEKPVPEDAEDMYEEVPIDPGDREGRDYLLEEETSMDAEAADAGADEPAELAASFTDDEDIKDEFTERQGWGTAGRKAMEEELDEYHAQSPEISAGDIDAAWQYAEQAGEETVGGTVPTPDQDQVDEIGQAAGLTYSDEEPLHGDKVEKRDGNRWELNPASQDETDQAEVSRIEQEEDEQEEDGGPS